MQNSQAQFGHIKQSSFNTRGFLSNSHIQTILPKFFFKAPSLKGINERVTTPDNDFVDLTWFMPLRAKACVILFHGLEGSANSHYIQHLSAQLNDCSIGAVVMHFRGCSGEPNLTELAYHSGAVFDPLFIIPIIKQRYPAQPLFAAGFSLGGNMLMKLLAHHKDLPIVAAVCVSAPLDLAASSGSINVGFSRLYQWHLMKSMKANLLSKMQRVSMPSLRINAEQIKAMTRFREFDDSITAVLHGFSDADDYYTQSSALPDLHLITTPTLVLHAKDDPFMDARVIPKPSMLSSSIAYELSEHGGHVGFMRSLTGQSKLWLPGRITQFFQEFL